MSRLLRVLILSSLSSLCACGTSETTGVAAVVPAPAHPAVVPAPEPAPATSAAASAPAAATPTAPPEPPKPPPPNPADVARARALVKRGELLYRNGEYEQAELVLKESMTLYPFLAQANLLLGKIFLIRGSAGRDVSLIHSARLMFEMARALDSSLREAEILLDLFLAPPLE